MATQSVEKVKRLPGSATYRWTGLANGDDGEALEIPEYPDHTMQVVGTFGSGGSVAWEGSNDGGTTWAALADLSGSVIAQTDTAVVRAQEKPRLVRPRVTAGDGTTLLDVYVHATR